MGRTILADHFAGRIAERAVADRSLVRIYGGKPLPYPTVQLEYLHGGTDESYADSDVVHNAAKLGVGLRKRSLGPHALGDVPDVALYHLAVVHEINVADELDCDGASI